MKWQWFVTLTLLCAMLTVPATGTAKAETLTLRNPQGESQAHKIESSTLRVVTDVYTNDEFVFGGIDALFHRSRNNVWLNFTRRQPSGVSITGTGRIQMINGRVEANGMIVLTLGPQAKLYVDLVQLNGVTTSPFEVGPGGGCLVGLLGVQTSPQAPSGVVVPVYFEFFPLDD